MNCQITTDLIWMTQYLCCNLNMRRVSDHSFKCLKQCRSRNSQCLCVCVYWDLLWMLMGLSASDWKSAMPQTVCVCVCVCDWWAMSLLLECVLIVNLVRVCVCYVTVFVIGYISLFRTCKENQIKLELPPPRDLDTAHCRAHGSWPQRMTGSGQKWGHRPTFEPWYSL